VTDSIFTASPVVGDSADGQPINTGTTFKVTGSVSCTHHRFFASTVSYAAVTVTARLYELSSDTAGTLLAEKDYSSVDVGAYNSLAWDTPVSLVTGKVYRTQHYASNGHYVATLSDLGSDVTSAGGLLVALADGTVDGTIGTVHNGKFTYDVGPTLAIGTSAQTNFFDDVIVVATGQSATLGIASETDTAIAVGRAKARLLGIASSVEAALTLGRAKARTLGIAAEADTALAVGRGKARLLGIASTTHTALPVGRAKARTLGIATETDTALPITPPSIPSVKATSTAAVTARRTSTSTVT
jgi:hypothetical protein